MIIMKKSPFNMSKWFYDTFPGVATVEPTVVLLLEGASVSWSLATDERGRHEDLRDSSRRSVIPYIHGRTELYC
jgi:hypothetical protein